MLREALEAEAQAVAQRAVQASEIKNQLAEAVATVAARLSEMELKEEALRDYVETLRAKLSKVRADMARKEELTRKVIDQDQGQDQDQDQYQDQDERVRERVQVRDMDDAEAAEEEVEQEEGRGDLYSLNPSPEIGLGLRCNQI